MTKTELKDLIKRRLGYPQIKIELTDDQINDQINYARDKFIKWATGQATSEVYFTIMLSGGQNFYDMPVGVTEVVSYDDSGSAYGINTLFTIDNFLYNQGIFESLYSTKGDGYSLISYHIARDFLNTVDRYTPSKYNWKYHRYTNELEIQTEPPTGNALNVDIGGTTYTFDSPGFVLIRAYMIEGSTRNSSWESGNSDNDFYSSDWILDYAEALCKITLGRIRSKFSSFTSIGNQGISLDGDALLSEGREDKERLEEKLKEEEAWDGFPVLIG